MKITSHVLLPMTLTLAFITAYADDAPVTVTNKLTTQKAWSGSTIPGYTSGQPEMLVNHFRIIPGGKTPVHLHPTQGAGYMISGELTMFATTDTNGKFDDDSKVQTTTLKAGEAWGESVNQWHYGVNNGEEDAIFVIVFASEAGTPATLSLVNQYPE